MAPFLAAMQIDRNEPWLTGHEAERLPRATLGDVRHVRELYRQAFGRYPNLMRPHRYTEKMQWRKLFDFNPMFAVLSDKIAVRDFIASRVGSEVLPPLLWVGDKVEAIPFERLEPPYILKCSHGSGFNVFVTSHERLDIRGTREQLFQWLSTNFGLMQREPGYPPPNRARLLAERMLSGPNGSAPPERKLLVFHGRVRVINSVVVDRDRRRFDAYYDPDWNWLGWRAANQLHEEPLPRPEHLGELIRVAERLGAGFDHVRVDTYDAGGGIRVGELTLYSNSGLTPFVPDQADFVLGSWWRLRHPMLRASVPILKVKLRNVGSRIKRRMLPR
jgi:hypothetical protein